MNCLKCTCTGENRHICNDLIILFNKLNIPHQEQIILWEMMNKTTDCMSLKNIVLSLQNKKTKRKKIKT
ncbi:MAG: hypothetical protein LBQ64_04715 [Bacteroidales bacterium]|jgi:hypothetical protein|nr:hypothetical protein [Bacteroidales bacterium]